MAGRYRAFISYSHRADEPLAAALQAGLQQFAKPYYAPCALEVFRDKTDLTANTGLWSSIEATLGAAAFSDHHGFVDGSENPFRFDGRVGRQRVDRPRA